MEKGTQEIDETIERLYPNTLSWPTEHIDLVSVAMFWFCWIHPHKQFRSHLPWSEQVSFGRQLCELRTLTGIPGPSKSIQDLRSFHMLHVSMLRFTVCDGTGSLRVRFFATDGEAQDVEIFGFAKDHYTVRIRPIPFVAEIMIFMIIHIFSMNRQPWTKLIKNLWCKDFGRLVVFILYSSGHTIVEFWSLYLTELRIVSLRGEGSPKLQHWKLGNESQKYVRRRWPWGSWLIRPYSQNVDNIFWYLLLVGLLQVRGWQGHRHRQRRFTSSSGMTCLGVLAETLVVNQNESTLQAILT